MTKRNSKKPRSRSAPRAGQSGNNPGFSKAIKKSTHSNYAAILDRAEKLLEQKDNQAAIQTAEALLSSDIREQDQQAFLFAARIKSFALANLKLYDQAAKISLEALAIDHDLLDFHYVLTFCCMAMEDYNLAEVYARKFIEVQTRQAADWEAKYPLSETRSHLYEVHNNLGVSLKEQSRYEEAGQAYENSYQLNPKYAPAYINHANLLHGQGDDPAALRVLSLALDAKIEAKEIRMLIEAYQPRPTVSVCMIVKNEERFLENCLKSVKDFADEIVVVDTGSTDRSVEIARQYGAKVYFHEWEDDFAKSRNQSLDYATKEWLFILDADEELVQEDIPHLREVMAQKKYNVVSINVYNLGPQGTAVSSFLPSIRMFRREVGARYDGIVHNQLKFNEDEEIVLRINAHLKHYGYGLDPERMKRKVERSRTLLLKQLEQHPDSYFAHFNLAQLYRGESTKPSPENCRNIIEHAAFVINHTDPYKRGQRHLHLMSLHQLVSAHFFLKEYDKAIEYCLKAIEYKPNFLDPIISLGHIYSQKHDPLKARQWFLKYLAEVDQYDETQEVDQIILLNLTSKHSACYGLALISEAEQKYDEAFGWYRQCLDHAGDYLDAHFRLGRILYNRGKLQEALQELERESQAHPENWAALFIQGEIFIRLNNPRRAEEVLLQAYQIQTEDIHLLYALARLYANTNHPEEALRYLRELQNADKNFVECYRLLGDIHFQSGQYREATASYTNFVIRNSTDFEVWNNLGNAHFKLEEYEQARECYAKALEIDATYSLARRNLAISLIRAGHLQDALQQLENYLQSAPDDLDFLIMAGELGMNLGQFEKAIGFLEKAIGFNPRSPELMSCLADCYFECGYLDSAKMGYYQTLQLNPNFKTARDKLVRIDELLADKNP